MQRPPVQGDRRSAGPILGGAIAVLVYEVVYLRTPPEPAPVGIEGTGVDEPGPTTTAL